LILNKNNYHTHTYRCKHAVGDSWDYAKAAAEAGLQILGISDHTPLPDNRWLEMRMDINELEDYIKSIELAKESFPQLTILKGMECEYLKEYHSFYSDELLGKHNFNYLSASAHFYPYKGEWVSGWTLNAGVELAAYVNYIVQMMDTGLFDYVAHPDAFGGSYPKWDEDAIACSRYLFEAAEALKVPLEINAYGFRKGTIQTSFGERLMYPWEPFWELASQYKILVTVNSDAHRPADIVGRIDDGLLLAKKYNLNVIDDPSFCTGNRAKLLCSKVF
jgi:histidinol-phosphatase (PHP family)